jgi:glycine/D-amino acid oxidase-like deaminating enzyme
MSTNTFSPASIESAFKRKGHSLPKGSNVIIVGAGAFGGWTALHMLRAGFHVTLVDAWGAGHSRSSSGDETRVIRSTYGANEFYFDLNVRALQLWKEHEEQWGRQVFHNSGVLWLCHQEQTPVVDGSIPFAKKHKMEYEYLSKATLQSRYRNVNTTDIHHAWLDPFGGYLKARESCQLVLETFIREGGSFVQAMVKPDASGSGIVLADGSRKEATLYIYACGSWLGRLFPDILGNIITASRQEVYYFGVPGNESEAWDKFPVWVDADGKDYYYGIPGNTGRGFKIGVDIRGNEFDPTNDNRLPDAKVLERARKFISHRFPALTNAPLIESRVCPYENSPDGNFIFQPHPHNNSVWFLGGGSGHGFKHGPALGELVASTFR